EGRLLLDRAKLAYDTIIHSKLFNEYQNNFSRYSIGLNKLRSRETFETKSLNQKIDQLKPMPMQVSIFNIGEKTSGVEPGFKAFLAKDPLLCVYHNFYKAEERWKYINNNNADIEKIYSDNKDIMPKYMVKLTYAEISSSGNVTPQSKDVGRANTMKKLRE